jgi:chromosome segregation ATPase
MESLTASDICRLEEEIFLHETAIESLNRKLESVKSQLDDEQKKLLIHKTRETELNAQCALLRNNLDEQTRYAILVYFFITAFIGYFLNILFPTDFGEI